jgi:hypothetical protein
LKSRQYNTGRFPAPAICTRAARLNYPRFTARAPATAFCIPIKSEFHDILFPELAAKVQFDLFAEANRGDQASRRPGNTIRKVYLCRAMT